MTQAPENLAVVRTSDRASFKRCRRRWNLQSHLGHNLEAKDRPPYFWLGTGGHYAMQDFHGYNVYGHPTVAFKAYVHACKKSGVSIPDDYKELSALVEGMLDYYADCWLAERDPLKTYYVDGVPQVEVNALIPLPYTPPANSSYTGVLYSVTLDRVVIDDYGDLWILDYKFNKDFRLGHLVTDDQISAYCWAAYSMYDRPIKGFIYQQHKKVLPKPPPFMSSGKFSTNKNMITSYALYKHALEGLYDTVKAAPLKNRQYLDWLLLKESEDRDAYIRRDFEDRSQHQIEATGSKIIMELEDILNPELPLYPNPNKDCSWDCNFLDACVMMDDGSDWEHVLLDTTQKRIEESISWRSHLPNPKQFK